MDEAIITFDGIDPLAPGQVTHWDVHGTMSRSTGDMGVTFALLLLKTSTIASSAIYSLNCKPTER